jgi:4-hydroxy-tetrahydrodipicolinate synthase
MPQMTKDQFELGTLRQVFQDERIAGIKDSSGNLEYFGQLLELKRLRPSLSVLVGPEHLLAETVRRGGDGGVNGGANFHPRLLVEVFDAVTRGDAGRADDLQRQLLRMGGVYRVGHHASTVIKGMKCACSLLGLCDDFMAEPFHRFRAPEREKVQAILRECGLLR